MSVNEELELAEIPGLGPVRRAALEEAGVTDLEALLAMTVAELSAVRGIGAWQARKIREFLRQRGLLVEVETDDGVDAVIVVEPRTAEEAEALSESIDALETQEAVEAEMEAEVQRLAEAVEAARMDAEERGMDALSREEQAVLDQVPGLDEGEPEAGADDGAEARELRERLEAQREQLPETALALMEAIRQAAVTPQLTRQMTRLLITASEFVSNGRAISGAQRRKASAVMARAEALLQNAIQKRSFGGGEQRDLARRLRRRRKELEGLLERS
jgi:hypothetical protein